MGKLLWGCCGKGKYGKGILMKFVFDVLFCIILYLGIIKYIYV